MALREGEAAADLARNPAFTEVLNFLSNLYLHELIESQPHETRTREERYLRIQVLRDIPKTLQARIDHASLVRFETSPPDNEENEV